MTSAPDDALERRYRRLLAEDLSSFVARAFRTVNPATPYLSNWHIDLIAEHLMAAERGQITRLIINMPPRMLKSITVSVAWPAWLLGRDPARRVIGASYAQHLALKHSLDCRLVVSSPWYRSLFPGVILATDQNRKEKFLTTARGYRMATSVGGGITGEGGNYLIVDDPQHPAQAESEVERRIAREWFDQSFSTRLDDKRRGVIVVVMQRLHQEDLTGHLLSKAGGGWEHLRLPAIAETPAFFRFGKTTVRREPGDLLHPEREGMAELERARLDLGSLTFAAQYQQQPLPREGGLFKARWMRRYAAAPAEPEKRVQSWDTAIKAGPHNDYSVCTTWAMLEEGYYLLDIARDRMEYPELKRAVVRLAEAWNANAILIEDKGSGQSLLQDLRRDTRLPLIPVLPFGDKLRRAAAVSPLFEAGRVFLPRSARWLSDYERELFSFPAATHDDQVDATTQFLDWARRKSGNANMRVL